MRHYVRPTCYKDFCIQHLVKIVYAYVRWQHRGRVFDAERVVFAIATLHYHHQFIGSKNDRVTSCCSLLGIHDDLGIAIDAAAVSTRNVALLSSVARQVSYLQYNYRTLLRLSPPPPPRRGWRHVRPCIKPLDRCTAWTAIKNTSFALADCIHTILNCFYRASAHWYWYSKSVCMSVCPSVTFRYSMETVYYIVIDLVSSPCTR